MKNLENDVLARKRPRFDKLSEYGFVKTADKYRYERDFANGDFLAVFEIASDGKIIGTVFDNMTGEIYLPLRIESRDDAFVNLIRTQYKEWLADIASHCYADVLFSSDQSNRLTERIFVVYNERPDFPWDEGAHKSSGTFRHTDNKKWFALIMNIKRSFLDKSADPSDTVDVINLKENVADIGALTCEKGVYPAYHMNHKNWISVLLDDTLSDNRIMEFIDVSFSLTK